jgi:small subunit ribosomal protein S17
MSRCILKGTVISDACDKSVVVKVQRRVKHPLYKKFITRSGKFMADDPENTFKIGDLVRIRECRPLSKRKTWEVIKEERKS